MINRTVSFICIILGVTLAGSALAVNQHQCKQLRGRGAGSIEMPSSSVVLMLFECAGMDKDVEALDPLDRDMMVIRAMSLPLKKLREQHTDNPPRKYSELTSAARLAKFKRLVVAYYKPGAHKNPPDYPGYCPTAGCVVMHCPPPNGPTMCCNTVTYRPC